MLCCSVTDCSVICVFTDDKFPALSCCTCNFRLSRWISWVMHSCSGLGQSRARSNSQEEEGRKKKMFEAWIVGALWWKSVWSCYRPVANCLEEWWGFNRKYTSCQLTLWFQYLITNLHFLRIFNTNSSVLKCDFLANGQYLHTSQTNWYFEAHFLLKNANFAVGTSKYIQNASQYM